MLLEPMTCHHQPRLLKDFSPGKKNTWAVQCVECGKTTRYFQTAGKAIEAWKVKMLRDGWRLESEVQP